MSASPDRTIQEEWISAFLDYGVYLRGWSDRILKRHQEEIRALQRHAAAMEQVAVDERSALIWLSQRLSDRGVIDASDLPADAVETTH